jgi:DNA-binding IclR family transcriptional regulator
MALASRIDDVLEFLASDSNPHSVTEISTALHLPLDACETIAQFLVQYAFAQWEDTKVRIDPTTRAFVVATMKEPLLQATSSR